MSDKSDDKTVSQKRAEAGRKGGLAAAGKPKTMTEAALKQRREAAKKSTGPITEAGKAASSRNGYKHGLYSKKTKADNWASMGMLEKPCKSTCPKFETCQPVKEGLTKPGQNCMDKQVYVEAFMAIMDIMQNGDGEYGYGMLANIGASAIAVLNDMREHIAHKSPVIMRPVINRQGEVVVNPETGEVYETPILNPVLVPYIKLLGELGVNLPELMATPRAIARDSNEKDLGDAVVDLFSGLGEKFGNRRIPHTIDGEADEL